eukprot:scaffold31531_cov35-Attheya_sp.AAC.2
MNGYAISKHGARIHTVLRRKQRTRVSENTQGNSAGLTKFQRNAFSVDRKPPLSTGARLQSAGRQAMPGGLRYSDFGSGIVPPYEK